MRHAKARTCWTVAIPTWSAAAMAASISPASAWSRRWARESFRAARLPCLVRARRCARAASLRVTRDHLAISPARVCCSLPREELSIKIAVEVP